MQFFLTTLEYLGFKIDQNFKIVPSPKEIVNNHLLAGSVFELLKRILKSLFVMRYYHFADSFFEALYQKIQSFQWPVDKKKKNNNTAQDFINLYHAEKQESLGTEANRFETELLSIPDESILSLLPSGN